MVRGDFIHESAKKPGGAEKSYFYPKVLQEDQVSQVPKPEYFKEMSKEELTRELTAFLRAEQPGGRSQHLPSS